MNRPIVLKHNKYIKIFYPWIHRQLESVTFFQNLVVLPQKGAPLMTWQSLYKFATVLYWFTIAVIQKTIANILKSLFKTESIIHISIKQQKDHKFSSHSSSLWACHISNKSSHVDMMNWLASSTTGEHQTSTQVKTKDSAQTDVQFLFCSHTLSDYFFAIRYRLQSHLNGRVTIAS